MPRNKYSTCLLVQTKGRRSWHCSTHTCGSMPVHMHSCVPWGSNVFFSSKYSRCCQSRCYGIQYFVITHFNQFISAFRDLFRRISIRLAALPAPLLHSTLSAQSSSVRLTVFCMPYAVTTICCTVQFNLQYSSTYSTAPPTVQLHLQYSSTFPDR